jgi:hypothetical protein
MGGGILYIAKLDPPEDDISALNNGPARRHVPDSHQASFISTRSDTGGAACFLGNRWCPSPAMERG